MTLDEQIDFLAEESARLFRDANSWERGNAQLAADTRRERAAMLLTIENTLRAVRDAR